MKGRLANQPLVNVVACAKRRLHSKKGEPNPYYVTYLVESVRGGGNGIDRLKMKGYEVEIYPDSPIPKDFDDQSQTTYAKHRWVMSHHVELIPETNGGAKFLLTSD